MKEIGVGGLPLEEVKGRGRTRVVTTIHTRGVWTQEDEYIRHIKLEIIAKGDKVEQVVESIMSAASTGQPGDDKIFVSAVDKIMDIGSRLSGDKAADIEASPAVKERTSQERCG
jgi:nitrogen regulatory protein PII